MLKKVYSIVLFIFQKLFGIDFAKKFDTKLRFHRNLNLKNPTSLADKVSYLELHNKNSLVSTCTDKLAVRDYIKSNGLGSILVPIVGNGGVR